MSGARKRASTRLVELLLRQAPEDSEWEQRTTKSELSEGIEIRASLQPMYNGHVGSGWWSRVIKDVSSYKPQVVQ